MDADRSVTVSVLTEPSHDAARGLADLLVDCVDGGASVGFLESLTVDDATAWWQRALAQPQVTTFVAHTTDGRLAGVVRLEPVSSDNGRHRAEVSKLLVRRDARRTGCASALMDALEQSAADDGRTLLVLDTENESVAQGFYARRGWQVVGTIPDYASTPDGRLAATTVMWKSLL